MCETTHVFRGIDIIYKKKIITLLFFFFSFFEILFPQDIGIKQNIINNLANTGFENIRIKYDQEKIIIAFENRVYRFEMDAVKEVLSIVIPKLTGQERIILVPENRKIPVVTIEVSVKDSKDYLSSNISGAEFAEKLKIISETDRDWQNLINETEFNSSNMKFDITFKPTVAAQFGVYTDPVMWQLNLVPGIKTSFWKGMNVNYELIIPIHNDLLPMEDSVRTGMAVINQTFRLPNSYFLSTSAGYFSNNRYGFDLELKKYLSNGNINVGLNFGITSFASFAYNKFYYSDIFRWTGTISSEFRITEYDLTLGLTLGKFLMGDNSVRFDINREFGEIEIGFFAIRSKSGVSNGGINISVPIFPSKYWKPGFLRVRTAEYFTWSYLVRSNTPDLIGLRYNTGNRLNLFMKKLIPSFIKNSFKNDY